MISHWIKEILHVTTYSKRNNWENKNTNKYIFVSYVEVEESMFLNAVLKLPFQQFHFSFLPLHNIFLTFLKPNINFYSYSVVWAHIGVNHAFFKRLTVKLLNITHLIHFHFLISVLFLKHIVYFLWSFVRFLK